MKTVLVTTAWLGNQDYIDRLNKWLRYYTVGGIQADLKYDDIVILDNASPFTEISKLQCKYQNVMIQRFTEHYGRPAHYDYMYLWRAVDFYKELFKEYDKVIYMDNDMYILSKNMVSDINAIQYGWESPWCKRHNFPETGLQIITKDNTLYNASYPWSRKNGLCMEVELNVTLNKNWNGDRHSEYGIIEQDKSWDFSAQVTVPMKMEYNLK